MTQKQRSHLHALDSAHRDGCEDRTNSRAASLWPWDDDPELTAAYMDGYNGHEMTHRCTRCGQASLTSTEPSVCALCHEFDRAPQGEAMRLFAPAPNQIEGQLSM